MRRERKPSIAAQESMFRRQATQDAIQLYERYGAEAIAMLTDMMIDPELSADERRRHRLARLEIERLDRERRRGHAGAAALVMWKPPLFSRAGLAQLLGWNGRRRRR